jgi:hypothetical protein
MRLIIRIDKYSVTVPLSISLSNKGKSQNRRDSPEGVAAPAEHPLHLGGVGGGFLATSRHLTEIGKSAKNPKHRN